MTEITFNQVDHDLGALRQQTVALEGFKRWVVGHDDVTGPAARVIRIALEDADADDSKGVTGKDIATGLKKVAITIRNIIKWLLRKIGGLIEKLGQLMQRVGQKAQKVETQAKAMGNEQVQKMESGEAPPKPGSFNAQRLAVAGKFVGNDLEQVKHSIEFSVWLIDSFLPGVVKVMEAIPNLASKHMTASSEEVFMRDIGQVILNNIKVPRAKLTKEDYAKDIDGDKSKLLMTQPLLGDVGFVMVGPESIPDVFGSLDALRADLHYAITPYSTEAEIDQDAEVTIKMTTVKTIASMVADAASKWGTGSTQVGNAYKAALSGIEDTAGKFAESDSEVTANIGNAIATIIQRLGSTIESGSKWANGMLSSELTYLHECMNAASGGGGEEE